MKAACVPGPYGGPSVRLAPGAEYLGRVGVTAHFFAYDPRAYPKHPTIDELTALGDLDGELEVAPDAGARLREVPTPLGDNKQWSNSLAGDFAWACARKHVEAAARAPIDRWLSHLFWDTATEGCPCGRLPLTVDDCQVVYEPALLEHILSLECALEAARSALSIEFDGDPPKTPRFERPWIYDFDEFQELALEWHRIFLRARTAGPGWCLLRWIWY